MFFSPVFSLFRRHFSRNMLRFAMSIACLLFPAAGLGWLLRQYCARSWNHRERWGGVWIGIFVSLSLSGLFLWRWHPFPALLISFWQSTRAHRFDLAGRDLLVLWLANGFLITCPVVLLYGAPGCVHHACRRRREVTDGQE